MKADPRTLSDQHRRFLAEVFERNRARFAGWHMEADPAPAPDPQPNPAPTPDPQPNPTPDPPPELGKGGKDAVLADLAKERGKRQQLETQLTDFQSKHTEQMDALAKALGLKQDEPADPEKLATQIAEEQARTRDAALQLAVYRTAGKHGANPDALLDSASFLRSVATLDPTDAAGVEQAIQTAMDTNPVFKLAAPVPPFGGGPRPTPNPTATGVLGAALSERINKPTR